MFHLIKFDNVFVKINEEIILINAILMVKEADYGPCRDEIRWTFKKIF